MLALLHGRSITAVPAGKPEHEIDPPPPPPPPPGAGTLVVTDFVSHVVGLVQATTSQV